MGPALQKNNDKGLCFWIGGLQRFPQARRRQFQQGLENIARQMSLVQVKTVGETAQKWAPAQGVLSTVIADANMQRGQALTPGAAASSSETPDSGQPLGGNGRRRWKKGLAETTYGRRA